MKYAKDDYRSHKPGIVLSKGPIYLIDGIKKDTDGELVRVPNMYYANTGPNRKTRRSIDAAYRKMYGRVAFAKMAKDRKETKKKVAKV